MPALIPFFLVVFVSIPFLKMNRHQVTTVFIDTASRIKTPFIALVGALIMVKFMIIGGDRSPIMTTRNAFAALLGKN